MLATHIWDYYDYTRDRDWLAQTGYPLLRESARFVCGYLWRQSNGRYTAAPSTSPEHGPIDKGATFANAVAKEVLMQAVEASKILATDEGERAQWDDVLRNIEPYQIGRYGQLMEWSRDIDNPKDEHRHTNHLFGLFPGTTISPVTTPQLAEAARWYWSIAATSRRVGAWAGSSICGRISWMATARTSSCRTC